MDPFHAIRSINFGPLTSDEAFLACCDPAVSGDLGATGNRGTWNSSAGCDIQMSKVNYAIGEQVVASVFRLSNNGTGPVAVEFKSWLDLPPGNPAVPILRFGADGSVVLPAGFNVNLGPLTLFTVTNQLPFGNYAFSCRLVDPVTSHFESEDLNTFFVTAFP
jgi:hypothetical protein